MLSAAQTANVAPLFAQGLAAHQNGRLADAERLYGQVLAARPEHFDALQMLGMVHLAMGRPADALRLVARAMHMRAPSPQILLNHGMILHALKRSDEALASFEQALRKRSKFAEAHNNKGAVLAALGRHREAVPCFRTALLLKPAYPDALYNLGSSLRVLGDLREAINVFDRALALLPTYPKALNNRGAAYELLGQTTEALADYEAALALDPDFHDARKNRSRVLLRIGRSDDALGTLSMAIAGTAADADVLAQRAKVYLETGMDDQAAADFAQALALQPNHLEAAIGSCIAELPIVYATEAEVAARRDRYVQKLRKLHAEVSAGRFDGADAKAFSLFQPFLLAYQGEIDRDLQRLYGEIVGRIMSAAYPPAAMPDAAAPGEKIRLGIVSPFFHLHSNWKIPIKGWLSQFDRSRFHITGYHLGAQRDAETSAAARMCDRFVQDHLDIDGWRREILADAPHVLIYPGLLMDSRSLALAAQRLAPVQCNSWGHPETSGLATLDYFLSSDLMEPPGAEAHYTEKLVRLPNLSIHYEPLETAAVGVTRDELGLRPGATVFWCAQSLYKYLPQHDAVFPRIASAVPDCQFVFIRHFGAPRINEIFEQRLDAAFTARGLRMQDHCVFLDRLSQGKFIAAAGLSDIFLDSIDWSGCNSMFEAALTHDLPVVTMAGRTMRARHGLAIMRMLEAGDAVTETVDEYVAAAVRLAGDPVARHGLRDRIAANKHKLYRDRAPIEALQDFLEQAVREAL